MDRTSPASPDSHHDRTRREVDVDPEIDLSADRSTSDQPEQPSEDAEELEPRRRGGKITRRTLLIAAGATAVVAGAATLAGPSGPPSKPGPVLITGTSSGLGRLSAEAFARAGWPTFATMRDSRSRNSRAAAELRALAARGLPIEVLDLDVRYDASVEAAVAAVLKASDGRLDVVINNAGIATPGPVELQDAEALSEEFETNLLGAHRVARAVLPAMRARRSGLILQMSSGMGRVVNPLLASYCATKWALEGLSEAMRYQLAPMGVDVCLVEPGPHPSRFAANAQRRLEAMVGGLAGDRRVADWSDMINRARTLDDEERTADPMDVVRALLNLAAMPQGQRPLRTVVAGPSGVLIDGLNATQGAAQGAFMQAVGLADLNA
jgi:NAD(P)-dependent dehydrogenase (short-subunit alcohol dehydrogenase family)